MKLSLVSYLDDDSSNAVRRIQRELSNITGSKASLSSWEPHVTISDGIEIQKSELELIKNKIKFLSIKTSTFELSLQGIGSLSDWKGGASETPYVIYLEVALNSELNNIVHEVSSITRSYDKWYLRPKPYFPHCTLAFRDLTKEGYDIGLKYLNNLNPTLRAKVDHIALVEKLLDIDQELVRFKFAD
jgi:2'-5' RNA ligase